MRERGLTEITQKIQKKSEKIPICPKWQHWSNEREGVDLNYSKNPKKIRKNSNLSEMALATLV